MPIDDLKLSDPDFFAHGDPHGLFTELRRDDPVHLTRGRYGKNFWSVTKMDDIRTVFRDPLLFSSQRYGPTLHTEAELADPNKSEHARLQQLGAMMPSTDPPRHGKLRAAFADRFAPSQIGALESRMRDIVRCILDETLAQEQFDFARQVSARLPAQVIFSLMDIPRPDWDTLFRFAYMHAAPTDPEFQVGTPLQTRQQGAGGLFGYCQDLARRRREQPGADLLSAIATARVDGQPLSDEELGFNGLMFVFGGQESTRNAVSAGVLEMIKSPALIKTLRDEPTLLATVPDEFVRWASPVAHLMRTATRDCELGGKQIRENDWVVCWMVSANRDEDVFDHAHELDPARAPNPHLGFGFGPHFCLGAHLARLEVRILIEELLERVEHIELAGPVERVSSIQFCGIKRMPVKVRLRAPARVTHG